MKYLILCYLCIVIFVLVSWYSIHKMPAGYWELSFIITIPLGFGMGGFFAMWQNYRDDKIAGDK